MELRTILDWEVSRRLKSVPGVVEVNALGGELKTYEVQLDPDRLLGAGDRGQPGLRGDPAEQRQRWAAATSSATASCASSGAWA